MKFNELTLTNFRSHKNSQFFLDRINVVRATNGAGKSSIAMALKYALTASCDVTDAAGRDAEDLIQSGGKEFKIVASADNFKIEASRNRAGMNHIVHAETSHLGAQAKQWIASHLAPIDVLAAVLDSHRFVEMSEKEQKALLAGALASDPVQIDAQMVSLLGLVSLEHCTSVSNAAAVDQIYKVVFDARAEDKRTLKAFGDPQPPAVPADTPQLGEVSGVIRDLENRKRELTTLRSRNVLAVQESNSKKKAAYVEKKNKLDTAHNIVKEMGGWLIDTSDELARLQKQLKGRSEATKLDTLIGANKAKQEALRSERANLTKPVQTECPTCHRPYTDLPDHSKRLEEISQESKTLIDDLQTLQDTRAKLPNFDEIQRRLDRHQQAMPKVLASETTIKDLGDLTEPEYPAANTDEIDAEITALEERITKGRGIEQQIVRYEEQVKAFEETKKKRADLEVEVQELETLCSYFGDKGPLKAALVGGKLPAFEARMNGVLARFGFHCTLSLDPYSITVAHLEGKSGLKLNQLSESQRFRFGIAFQVALAEVTGVRLVVIDRADMLSNEARGQLIHELEESKLDQAFILATGDPFSGDLPEVPGVAFFELAYDNINTTVGRQSAALHAGVR